MQINIYIPNGNCVLLEVVKDDNSTWVVLVYKEL